MGAIALILPSGYSYGPIMLFLGGLGLLWKRPAIKPEKDDILILSTLAVYSLLFMTQLAFEGVSGRYYDRPFRFLLAIPALFFVLAFPPRLKYLWSGMVIGNLLTATWALWQKLVLGLDRASGYTHKIQFGNISMLMGIFCLAGLGWASNQKRPKFWIIFLIIGAIAGALGSLLSGSRGGWIGLPFVFLVLYKAYGNRIQNNTKAKVIGAVLLGALAVYAIPQTGVKKRVNQAFSDIERYQTGESRTSSLGTRFEMWKGAIILIAEKPLLGHGWNGYNVEMTRLVNKGIIHPVVIDRHAHNEYLDNFARRGILGLVSLLALYLIPLSLFSKRIKSEDLEIKSLATAGTLLSVAYMDFGLSQVFLSHNSGVMVYAFWMAALWACLRRKEKCFNSQLT